MIFRMGTCALLFTTDEEVGSGACHMDLERFGAPYAYTVDGGPEGEIQFENFNAASAEFAIHGVNVHPGEAKDIMVNSMKLPWSYRVCCRIRKHRSTRKVMKDFST